MDAKTKAIIQEYQCMGCIYDPGTKCFEPQDQNDISCSNFKNGSIILGVGYIFSGLPKGFTSNKCYAVVSENPPNGIIEEDLKFRTRCVGLECPCYDSVQSQYFYDKEYCIIVEDDRCTKIKRFDNSTEQRDYLYTQYNRSIIVESA